MDETREKSLAEKLGFAPGDSIFVETTPDWYTQFADDNGLELEAGLPATHAHIFGRSKTELADFLRENDLPQIEKSLWISWLKKDSGHRTDLTEHDIRAAILPLGWVDNKVASVDADWSGLKFVRRKA
ncbi:MAG TPA: hypothetical protein VGM08_00075 [Candidatus Saccharimonadales bacterium]|jgi:hypothetical protein